MLKVKSAVFLVEAGSVVCKTKEVLGMYVSVTASVKCDTFSVLKRIFAGIIVVEDKLERTPAG